MQNSFGLMQKKATTTTVETIAIYRKLVFCVRVYWSGNNMFVVC